MGTVPGPAAGRGTPSWGWGPLKRWQKQAARGRGPRQQERRTLPGDRTRPGKPSGPADDAAQVSAVGRADGGRGGVCACSRRHRPQALPGCSIWSLDPCPARFFEAGGEVRGRPGSGRGLTGPVTRSAGSRPPLAAPTRPGQPLSETHGRPRRGAGHCGSQAACVQHGPAPGPSPAAECPEPCVPDTSQTPGRPEESEFQPSDGGGFMS